MARRLRMLDGESGIVEITSRVQQGRYLLLPTAQVNDLILGVLGRAQRLYPVRIFCFIFMSNHFHILIHVDSAQQMARFMEYLKGNIAKELGPIFEWKERFWGKRYHSASINSDETLLNRFLYILTNSCKEGLVASPLDWPGVTSARALYRGETTMQGTWYDRTAEYRARKRGQHKTFPTTETVHLSPLPILEGLSAEQQREFIVRAVRQVEEETAERHRINGTQPLGTEALRRQHPHDKPKEFEPSPAPPFHAATPEEYRTLREARALKVAAYRDAAERLKRGELDVQFPEGCFPPPRPFVESRAPT